ncbi:hypothetical protein AB0L05_16070 [Nonomuraea pusilla]|uniref:hypothetical protein n=1 Tax=Nonomuraea pusilla TaxID=46177 RepID=UPI0033324314
MQNPTSDTSLRGPAPSLLGYETWSDETGFHARYIDVLPQHALAYGCQQTITAATELELRQAAVRNRIRIETWDSEERLAVAKLLARAEDPTPPAE